MHNIIKRPIITEKSMKDAAKGWYTFGVSELASKPQIAQSVHDMFGVTVLSVRTMRMVGKARRAGKSMRPFRKPDWKKALVQVQKGQTIDAFTLSTGEESK